MSVRRVTTDADKARKLRAALTDITADFHREGHPAAELTLGAMRKINSLCDREAARVYDAIRAS